MSEIIDGRYFRIPDYQRGYAWGNRQLEEFWGDLTAVIQNGGKHYTGAITVKAMTDKTEISMREGFEVVDGQQRLTTIAILLSVLKGRNNPFCLMEQQVVRHIFSYGSQNVDAQFLCNILSVNALPKPDNSHQRNLKKALEFFQTKTANFDNERKNGVAGALMSHLTFDFRIINSDYSAGIVFETMNNRGKPLTLLEKLKNRLMYLVETLSSNGNDEDAQNRFEKEKTDLRSKIDGAWGHIYQSLASNPSRDPLDEDEFIAAHLSVYRAPKESVYSKSVAESRLFKMFSSDAERHPKSERVDENDGPAIERAVKEEPVSIEKVRDYVEDLVEFAKPWATINNDYDSALGRCRLLSGTQEVKVFLATVLLHSANKKDRATNIFENAEQILFRNTIRSVMDEATLATLARRLHGKCRDMLKRGDNEQIDIQGVEDSLRGVVNDDGRKINAEKLVDYFVGLMSRQQSPYGFYGWRGLKYFLFKQENGGGLGWEKFDEASLEHVMPQSSTVDGDDGWWVRQMKEFTTVAGFEEWDTLRDEDRRNCRQCKRNVVNSLGNFVLLTQTENASVSDDPWEGYPAVTGQHKAVIGKKVFYSDKNRTSSSGARQVAQAVESWNAFCIRERGRNLFRNLSNALGVSENLEDEQCDSALGFDFKGAKSLQNSSFRELPQEDVNRLAPRLGTAAEPRLQTSDAENGVMAFWDFLFEVYPVSALISRRDNQRPYISYDTLVDGVQLTFVFNQHQAKIECNIDRRADGVYKQLWAQKQEIETAVNHALIWEQKTPRGGAGRSRVSLRLEGCSIAARADWQNVREWFCKYMPRFEQAIGSALRRR